jgi:plastocyanin
MRHTRSLTSPAFILVLGLAAACGGSSYAPTSVGDVHTVTATSARTFTPAALTVDAGTEVRFAFGTVAHNVFFDAVAGAPANIEGANANVSFTRTFATAGDYHYTCHIHAGMQGTVHVE